MPLNIDNKVEKDQTKIAETFADYFSTIASNIGGEIVAKLKSIRNAYTKSNFQFRSFVSAEVQNALENIDARKSPGWDGLSPKILKITAKGLASALTSMYNNCISLS